LRAAVANGANAIYFGLSSFNARHRATNFTLEELPRVIDYLHRRNVRGYVAFNTLIFTDELADAVCFLASIAAAGADAVIVQDLGLIRLIRRLVPGLAIHASTQTTQTEPRGIEFLRRLGVERVILARELSATDIERIAGQTPMPLEVFVHGALCVAYSGQCLTSEALGGRSANRGQCAQACRLPYDLRVDGQPRDLGDRAYLLSPQDLAAHDLIDRLVRLGVCSFKIEGRLKSSHYVAVTTQTYRAALDAALAETAFQLPRQGQLDLAQAFSRGLTHGFLDGVNHQMLVEGRFPKSRGVRIGTVVGKTNRGVVVALAERSDQLVKPGDGVVFDEGHPEQEERGGRVFGVRAIESMGEDLPRVEVVFGREGLDHSRIGDGARVWKTDDPALRKRLEQTFADDAPARRAPISARVEGAIGTALRLRLADDAGHEAVACWDGPLVRAEKHPLSAEVLREQLGRLGDTPFVLGQVASDLRDPVMVPKSVLNDLRRKATAALIEMRLAAAARPLAEADALDRLRAEAKVTRAVEPPPEAGFRWYVLVRTLAQLDAVLAWRPPASLAGPSLVYCDFEDVRRYRDAVARARAARVAVGLASLRIVKPGEDGLLRLIAGCDADALLVRNLAALEVFAAEAPPSTLVGDFSLNVANELTADLFARQGLRRLVPSYDLSWEQLTAMLGRIDPGLFEVVVHQHMPMFHMEHCVFAAFLSEGKDWRDCGRPCDHHRLELRDRMGADFPVLADTGCRNTVFNSVAQSAAEYLPRMQALGLCHFRVELLRETSEQVAPLLETYARVLAGRDDGRRTWRSLQALNQLGVTRGTLQSRGQEPGTSTQQTDAQGRRTLALVHAGPVPLNPDS